MTFKKKLKRSAKKYIIKPGKKQYMKFPPKYLTFKKTHKNTLPHWYSNLRPSKCDQSPLLCPTLLYLYAVRATTKQNIDQIITRCFTRKLWHKGIPNTCFPFQKKLLQRSRLRGRGGSIHEASNIRITPHDYYHSYQTPRRVLYLHKLESKS